MVHWPSAFLLSLSLNSFNCNLLLLILNHSALCKRPAASVNSRCMFFLLSTQIWPRAGSELNPRKNRTEMGHPSSNLLQEGTWSFLAELLIPRSSQHPKISDIELNPNVWKQNFRNSWCTMQTTITRRVIATQKDVLLVLSTFVVSRLWYPTCFLTVKLNHSSRSQF